MERVKLKDICTLINGRAYKQEELLSAGKYPVLRVGNFFSEKDYYYSDLELEDDKYCDNGDLLFAWSASFGPKIWNGNKVIYHYHIWKIVITSKVFLDYLYYYLLYFSERIKNEGHGGIMIHVTKAEMEEREILLPAIDIQEKISSVLNKLNRIINKRKNQLQKLDNLIKARFVEMFGSVEKKIPLSTLCDVSGGYSFKSGDITSDGAVKILQIGNVYLDDISWETTNYLPKGYDETYSRFLLNKGDIVVALTRPIIQSLGNVKACIVRDLDLPCLLNQRVGRIVPRNNREVSNQFIYGCLMTCDFTRYVKSCCIGCSQPNISSNDIGNYMIPDVSFNEQMMFVNFKEQIDKSKVAIQKSLAETQLLFDKLMQDYFG